MSSSLSIKKSPPQTASRQRSIFYLSITPHWAQRLTAVISLVLFATMPTMHADTFQSGIEAYQNAEYETAIAQFTAALKSNETAAARHNLGLSHFQLGAPAEAVWQLERAQLLAPYNADYRYKLAALRQQLGLLPSAPKWYALAAEALPTKVWLIVACSGVWGLLAACFLPRRSGLTAGIGIKFMRVLCIIALILSLTSIWLNQCRLQTGTVIADESVSLHAAPAAAAPQSGSARPGERGRILDQHNDFYSIETEGRARGWISKHAFRALTD
jgi:tetratricopeptide (TPR) repeat protein